MAKVKPISQTLKTLIKARYPIIYLQTFEEERAVKILMGVTNEINDEQDKSELKKKILVWSFTTGICDDEGKQVQEGTEDPKSALDFIADNDEQLIIIFKDLHRFLDERYTHDHYLYRKLRDLNETLKATQKTIILLSPIITIPEELSKSVHIETLPLPTTEELATVLDMLVHGTKKLAEKGDPKATEITKNIDEYLSQNGNREALLRAGLGLTLNEYEDVLVKSLVENHTLNTNAIIPEKEQIIKKSGVLEFFTSVQNMDDVGGLKKLKRYIVKRKHAFSQKAIVFGLKYPKGVLLAGAPGTGKTLVAKVIAWLFEVPLLRVDISRIYGGVIGATEQNIRRALEIAEAVAPCVLLFDEMEKALAGSSSGETDSGVSSHLRSILLTWMQEHEAPVFVVGTVNQPNDLNPAIMRAGRFDETFFVDLPNETERAEIFGIHIRKVGRKPENFNLQGFATKTEGFSGAEIEAVVQDALNAAFDENETDLTDELIQDSISETRPLSKRRPEDNEKIRLWGKSNAVNASEEEVVIKSDKKKKQRDMKF